MRVLPNTKLKSGGRQGAEKRESSLAYRRFHWIPGYRDAFATWTVWAWRIAFPKLRCTEAAVQEAEAQTVGSPTSRHHSVDVMVKGFPLGRHLLPRALENIGNSPSRDSQGFPCSLPLMFARNLASETAQAQNTWNELLG